MRSKWFNPVLPPYRRKHWIKSFWPHFPFIPAHPNIVLRTGLLSTSNDVWMVEWWQNGKRQKIQFFLPSKKLSHSSSFCHSCIIFYCVEWHGMEICNGESSFKPHSSHFCSIPSNKNDDGMTEWGEMKTHFLTKAKPLILELLSFHNHPVIPCQFSLYRLIIPVIWVSFLILMTSQSRSIYKQPNRNEVQMI